MIGIKVSANWSRFNKIYGSKDIVLRYQWFLFEFGKRASKLFYKHMLQRISEVPGTKEYKKRLMVAEIRDRGRKSWWAIVASAKPMGDALHDPKTSVFQVIPRYQGIDGDPVSEILEKLGPWTIETLPFLPSPRAGQVVMKTMTEGEVESIADRNFANGKTTHTKMVKYGLTFTPRHVLYQRLRVIRDIEIEALRIEFGLAEKSKPHWRPSLRWIRRQGIKKLEQDRDLIRVWIDPRFSRYRLFRHFRVKLTQSELKSISRFEDKVRQG